MSNAIEVRDLSKIYRLGEIGTGTLSRDLHRWVNKVLGKEDPFLKIGESNDRTKQGNSDIVYSLRDLSFDIEQGDAIGIIGRNGAGKSTLLKILSRVTAPTTGTIHIKGRVASLLEVGTGFHPELTGRENIYLNGAILGMRKREITRKLDQIIDFSGVERYIDTPVKRYSSGMYVRLAFAVAAHLESEVLIVDEVLAVGDAEFQQKCIGKMGEVSKGEGRTILFVSHNMAAISSLCKNAIILNNGKLNYCGDVKTSIKHYLNLSKLSEGEVDLTNKKHHQCLFSKILKVRLEDEYANVRNSFVLGNKINVIITFELKQELRNVEIGFCFKNYQGTTLLGYVSPWDNLTTHFMSGKHCVKCEIYPLLTLPGNYSVTIWVKKIGEKIDDEVEDAIEFEVISEKKPNNNQIYYDRYSELNMYQKSNWETIAD